MTIHAQERLLERFGLSMSLDRIGRMANGCIHRTFGPPVGDHENCSIYQVEVDGVTVYPVVKIDDLGRPLVSTFLTKSMVKQRYEPRPRRHRRKAKYHGSVQKKAQRIWRMT